MRRAWVVMLAALLTVGAAAEPALINGGFEEILPGGPQGWSFDHWQGTGGASGSTATTAHGGKLSVLIDSAHEDDARFIQIVAVKPATWYRFSAWIKTQNVDTSKVGAHLSVMGAQQAVADVRGTQDWTKTEVAFRTASDQRELTLALRLGFYGGTTTGRAWFDDAGLVEAPSAAGLPVLELKAPSPRLPSSSIPETLAALLLYLLVWWLARRAPELRWPRVAVALGVVLAAKLVVSGLSPGYPADVGTFSAWAQDVFRLGPSGFYREGYFADYPPGYLYVLWVIDAIANLFHVGAGSPLFLALLKLPAVLADFAGVLVLWRLSRERSALAGILWLLSPLAFLDSAVWGQVDSVFSLALLGAFALLELRRLSGAALLLAVSVLLKPQALLAVPLALLWLASERPPLKTLWKPLVVSVSAVVLLVLPFTWNKPPLWIFGLYAQTLGSYDFASLNAANLWYLLGLNWAPASGGWGLSYTGWGWLLTAAGILGMGWGVWKSRLPGRWLFAAFGVYVLVFAFSTRMHERYLFPAALLGLGAYQLLRDPRLLWASLAAGLIAFADVLVTLETMWGGSSAVAPWHPVLLLASIGTVALAGFTVYLAFDLLGGHVLKTPGAKPVPLPGPPETRDPLEPSSPQTQLKAALAVGGLTLVYAVAALLNLGSASSPQRFWEPRNPGESQTFDLGAARSLKAVEYHLGLGSGQFSLEYSSDGLSWKRGLPIVNDNPYAEFRWRTLEDPQTARFVRISLVRGRQQVNELALVDTSGAFVDPAAVSQLFDEPSTRVALSDYSNGMYFDEVYFARSGWEIVQGREATENTHPPLGKVVLAGSISLLGMNPLAWRLPGTLFGIAMIPLLYLLAFRLFGSRLWAWLAALFLAVDFLHFTQTRIGTVDGYVMLFALSAYYWIVRWYQDSKKGGGQPGWSLVFSGISIALAIATKWIGLYAGAGLAALFVLACVALGKDWLKRNGARTLAIGVVSFVIIPLGVYIASYIPQMLAVHGGLQAVIDNQTSMWNYHSQIKATHPFSSPWYQWPLMVKPIWYYSGSANLAPELASTIVALGNPVVWWGGSAAFLYAVVRLFRRPRDVAGWFIVIAGLAQYLPWAVIPRKLVFLYHFFMTVPFLILALTLALRDLAERLNGKLWPAWAAGSAAVALFAVYFPVLGGTPFPRWWAEGLRALGIPVYF